MKVVGSFFAVALMFISWSSCAIELQGTGWVRFGTTVGTNRECGRSQCDYDSVDDAFLGTIGSASGAANAELGMNSANSGGVIGARVGESSIRLGHAWSGSVLADDAGVRSEFHARTFGAILFDPETPASHFSATFLYDIIDGPVFGGRGILDEITASIRADGAFPLSFTTGAIGTFNEGGAITRSGTVSESISGQIASHVAVTAHVGRGFDEGGFRSSLNIVIGRGASQENPVLPAPPPSDGAVGSFLFENAQSGAWFDPTPTETFDFEMQDYALFTHIISLPEGFDDPFTVTVGDQVLGEYGPGEVVSFLGLLGDGVSSFSVSGINPLVDGEDPMAFPIQLAFDNPTATFTMTAAPVPLPAPILFLSSALAALGLLRRPRAVCS